MGILVNCLSAKPVLDIFIKNNGIEMCIDILKNNKNEQYNLRALFCLNKLSTSHAQRNCAIFN